MRLLVFTDMHGSEKAFENIKKKSKNADLILNCGDFTIFQQKMAYWLKRFESLKKPMLIVPGNHENEDELSDACSRLKHVQCLVDEAVLIEGVLILAAEGNGFALRDKRFEMVAKVFKKIIKKSRPAKLILMTHAPPHGTDLDSLVDGHTGNKTIRDFIRQAKPDYAFCGHIEENSYKKDKIGKTVVWNPGPEGRLLSL
ncbi:metallophosphoesterase family protein [Candidatus Woesearchaeota archaeon]|nr:metallophosphoesterase family protein [Candidatus Woesearchaeota archaeon]